MRPASPDFCCKKDERCHGCQGPKACDGLPSFEFSSCCAASSDLQDDKSVSGDDKNHSYCKRLHQFDSVLHGDGKKPESYLDAFFGVVTDPVFTFASGLVLGFFACFSAFAGVLNG